MARSLVKDREAQEDLIGVWTYDPKFASVECSTRRWIRTDTCSTYRGRRAPRNTRALRVVRSVTLPSALISAWHIRVESDSQRSADLCSVMCRSLSR